MPEAVVDANVLFGAFNERDQYHDRALPIVRAFDRQELPRAHLTTFVLPEVLNPTQQREGHDYALDVRDRLSKSVGFAVRHPTPTRSRGARPSFGGSRTSRTPTA